MAASNIKPFLSIIIPAHNESLRLPATLTEVATFVKKQSFITEVLVVENASMDGTFDLAVKLCKSIPRAKVMQEPIKGKGQAIRHGMLAARGEYCLIFDADLAMPVKEITKFIPPALNNCDIAIASREAKGAQRHQEPLYRYLIGRVFNLFVRVLVLPGFKDTQCGYKCFRSHTIEKIFSRQTMSGLVFDVELLAIARQRGYTIKEIPIEWHFGAHSRVRMLIDAPRMFKDLLKIRANVRNGVYK